MQILHPRPNLSRSWQQGPILPQIPCFLFSTGSPGPEPNVAFGFPSPHKVLQRHGGHQVLGPGSHMKFQAPTLLSQGSALDTRCSPMQLGTLVARTRSAQAPGHSSCPHKSAQPASAPKSWVLGTGPLIPLSCPHRSSDGHRPDLPP